MSDDIEELARLIKFRLAIGQKLAEAAARRIITAGWTRRPLPSEEDVARVIRDVEEPDQPVAEFLRHARAILALMEGKK